MKTLWLTLLIMQQSAQAQIQPRINTGAINPPSNNNLNGPINNRPIQPSQVRPNFFGGPMVGVGGAMPMPGGGIVTGGVSTRMGGYGMGMGMGMPGMMGGYGMGMGMPGIMGGYGMGMGMPGIMGGYGMGMGMPGMMGGYGGGMGMPGMMGGYGGGMGMPGMMGGYGGGMGMPGMMGGYGMGMGMPGMMGGYGGGMGMPGMMGGYGGGMGMPGMMGGYGGGMGMPGMMGGYGGGMGMPGMMGGGYGGGGMPMNNGVGGAGMLGSNGYVPSALRGLNTPAMNNYPVNNPAMMNRYSTPTSPTTGYRPNTANTASQDCVGCRSIRSNSLQPIAFNTPTVRSTSDHFTEATFPRSTSTSTSRSTGGDRVASNSGSNQSEHYEQRPSPVRQESPIRAPESRRRGVGAPVREELSPAQLKGVRARSGAERSAQKSPIWNSFIKNFRSCAPGCEPANYAAYGRRGNASCHPSGKAIDVGAITCGDQTYQAIQRGRYEEMVRCMQKKMTVLYRNGAGRTSGHRDHGHFSNGCYVNGQRIW